MLDCLIIGDSIAVGVAAQAPQCVAHATVGISSKDWLRKNAALLQPARKIVVSLGTNDGETLATYEQLTQLRRQLISHSVVWILPSEAAKPWGRYFVSKVAYQFGDRVVSLPAEFIGPDHIHPTRSGYSALAGSLKPI